MSDAVDNRASDDCQHPYGSVEEVQLGLVLSAISDLEETINVGADVCTDCNQVLNLNGLDTYPISRLNNRLTDDEDEDCVHPFNETTTTDVTFTPNDGTVESCANHPEIQDCTLCTACMRIIETDTKQLEPATIPA